MKKHQIIAVVGTIALAANLLLPNISFAQNNQTGTVNINCTAGTAAALTASPADVTFTSQASPVSGTVSTFDSTAITTTLPANHLLQVTDKSSAGISGCPLAADQWTLAVSSTDLSNGGTGINAGTIAKGDIDVATSTSIDTTAITANSATGLQTDTTNHVIWNDYVASHNGNPHNVVAGEVAKATDFQALTSFGDGLSNTRTLLSRCSTAAAANGEDTDVATGVVFDINNGIKTLQPYGTYTGTITYTFAPGNC
jgi:hypothetical protein